MPGANVQDESSALGKTRVIDGSVRDSDSFWRHGRIITRSLVRTDDGTELAFEQIGGSVGEISMVQFPSEPIPRAGDRISALIVEPRDSASVPRLVDILNVEFAGPLTTGEGYADAKFVRTTNSWNVPLHWENNCIFIQYDDAGTNDLPGDTEFAIMDQVFATWESVTAEVSYLNFELQGAVTSEIDGRDRVNVIKFLEDVWGPEGCDQPMSEINCYNRNAAAITTVSFLNTEAGTERAGEIIDADIEFNGVDFAVSADGNTEADPLLCKSDLANTLTHEVGHLMGLDHTCVGDNFNPGQDPDGNPKPWPTDDSGEEVPFCSEFNLPQEVIESTMNAFQSCGETIKASPAQDDIDAVGGVFPLADAPGQCAIPAEPVSRRACVCQVGTSGEDSPVAPLLPLALIGLGLLFRQRRKRATG